MLNPSDKQLNIRESSDQGIYVEGTKILSFLLIILIIVLFIINTNFFFIIIYLKLGLCELIVKDSKELMRLIEQGNTVRKVLYIYINSIYVIFHVCY